MSRSKITSLTTSQINAQLAKLESLANTALAKAVSLQNNAGKRVLYVTTPKINTGNVVETTIYSEIIPAGTFTANSSLHIPFLISATSNTNSKTFRLKINNITVVLFDQNLTSETLFRGWLWFSNRNSFTSQITAGTGAGATSVHVGWNGTQTAAYTTYNFNTAADITISATSHLAVGADTQSLEQMDVIIYP